MPKQSSAELVSNRKARHHYEIIETYEAGIALLGTEIKSLRHHGGGLQDAYVVIDKNEAWLKNASIAPYQYGNIHNHEEKRDRKLLLHRRELIKLKQIVDQKGLTLIPLSFYLNKGRVKVKLAIARGKKLYDKRKAIQEREIDREMARALKTGR